MNNNGSRSRRQRNRKHKGGSQGSSSAPFTTPQVGNYIPNPVFSRTFRYQATTASTTGTVTNPNLLLSQLILATSATTGNSVFNKVKINWIKIWGPVPTAFTPVTVGVEFRSVLAPLGSSEKQYTDTSVSTTFPAYVKAKPIPGTTAAMWQGQSTVSSIFLTFPVNAIVDVNCSFTLDNFATGVANTLVGATTGVVYFKPVDSTGFLVPVSFQTA